MFNARRLAQLFGVLGVILITAGITHTVTVYSYKRQISTYFDIESQSEKTKDVTVGYDKPKITVDVGIIIPDHLLTGDPEKDWQYAESFFTKEQKLTRSKTGTLPGISGHTGFSFKCSVALP